MITLCGGLQVSDNPLVTQYLLSHCLVATSTTDFMNRVIRLAGHHMHRDFDKIRESVNHVAHYHTYFNRLQKLFSAMELSTFAHEAETKGKRIAVQHCWELEARLSAEERGVPYEQKTIRSA